MANSTQNSSLIRPEDIGDLVVKPFLDASRATQVATQVTTSSPEFRIPIVEEDPSAAWLTEGEDITESDITTAEVLVEARKIAGLTVITRELANDSTPAAAEVVGQSLVRDLAQTVDQAFFNTMAEPAPSGLESLTGVTQIPAGTEWTDLDAFASAQAAAEQEGVTVDTWVANPQTAVALAQLRTDTTSSNQPLLGPDPTQPTRRQILGAPLLVSRHVQAGTVWGIPRDRVYVVIREGVELQRSEHAFFRSDRIGVRAIMRLGFGFPHQAAITKVTIGNGDG